MVPLKVNECSEKYSRCQVENCSKDPRFTIHNIPQSNKIQKQRIREQWIKILNIETKAKTFYVCGNHFSPEDFTNINGGRPRLNSSAVPNRNLPRLSTSKQRIVYNHQDDNGYCNNKIVSNLEQSEIDFYNALQDETFTVIMSLIESGELTTLPIDNVSNDSFESTDAEFNIPFNIKRELDADDIKIEYVTPGANETDEILEMPKNNSMPSNDHEAGSVKSEITYGEYQFSQSNNYSY